MSPPLTLACRFFWIVCGDGGHEFSHLLLSGQVTPFGAWHRPPKQWGCEAASPGAFQIWRKEELRDLTLVSFPSAP